MSCTCLVAIRGRGLHAVDCPADREEIAHEREQIAQGICPQSGQQIMPGGVLRPACSFCDCGEEDDR